MNNGSESLTDIEAIYKSIPLGTRNHTRIIQIHTDGEKSIDIETLSRTIGNKTCYLIDTYLTTKQHGRHISWILDGEILHINLPELPTQ